MELNRESRNFRVFGPDETASNRLDALYEVTEKEWIEPVLATDEDLSRDGRVLEVLSEHVSGVAGGLSAHRAARLLLLLRRLHPHRGFDVQSACKMAGGHAQDSLASTHFITQLSAYLARLAPGPQRLQPPGPGLH